MPAVLSIVSDRVKFSQFCLSASIASSLIFPFHLRAGIRLHSLIRAPDPSSLAAQDSVQSHTRSHRRGSRRTKPAKTHHTTSFIKSHTQITKNERRTAGAHTRQKKIGIKTKCRSRMRYALIKQDAPNDACHTCCTKERSGESGNEQTERLDN
jgi:hypothetical protein